MNKLLLAATAATLSFALAPGAHAQQSITITGASGNFGDPTVRCDAGLAAPCGFSRTFQFVTPVGFSLTSATITSVMAGNNGATNIDFSSVTLNGVQFNTVASGVAEFRSLFNQTITPGALNTIFVSGTTGGDGAFTGTLSFAAAVPEPATWGMMILGFGAVGYTMRRRRADVRLTLAA